MKKNKQQRNHDNHAEYTQQNSEYQQDPIEREIVPHQPLIRKSLGWASLIIIAMAILGSFLTTSFSDEGTAEEVVANRISQSTTAGESLFENETNGNIKSRDFQVTNAGSDGGEARMLIWDFNKVDLDEVAIFVDGVPVKEKLILSDKAAAISIPVPSKVTISGVKDLGGGISYAVKFPNNKNTYFNVVSVGQSNTYTVLPRP
ncbi:hypothetical protein SAMN05444673_3418 [Bacillus sp. OV166]|uniref:hypothetical protein n=1 Tax=Bacillus sp. OV166 TaxID=1882763 RepID=UPI000A2ACB73|nr:hypothetical protein [Bacillus sp. OV166]SMQ78414.1 hypothetical protein SAMN05444673_3418 [Bacillus sp. OV166]